MASVPSHLALGLLVFPHLVHMVTVVLIHVEQLWPLGAQSNPGFKLKLHGAIFFFFTDWHSVEGHSLSACTERRKSTLREDTHYLTLALSFMSSGQNINPYQPRQATVRFPKLIPCGYSGVNVFF